MSSWCKLYYKLLNLSLSILIKSKVIPTNSFFEHKIDPTCPVLYVLLYDSKAALFTLREQCLKYDLPDPLAMLEIDGALLPSYVFIHDGPRIFPYFMPNLESVKLFYNYLDLHRSNPHLNVQILPVLVMFGRSPGREIQGASTPHIRILNGVDKFFTLLWHGRDSFVRFSPTISLRQMATKYGTDKSIAQKLTRVARIHFSRQRLAAVGPKLTTRQDLFKQLLQSKAIEKAIEEEMRNKKITHETAKEHAIEMMKEIAANFSYEAIRVTDRVMGWLWNRLYQGINVHGSERVRQLAQDGHEIVYVPCHRSHMDYLLLSYVLYHQGLVPPHIAAGINLNFWPAGQIFCRLGAFFIRRTFKGNKLYSTVFREYLGELFSRGYSVEYFIEGGRSRTGRLLAPKTGTLSMTLQVMLRGSSRPITFVPIYIGYEHVIEVDTYAKELRGAVKKKEGIMQMMRGLRKLRNLGQSYVNFGEPLPLLTYLNNHIPEWRESINAIEPQRPTWMTPTVNDIAFRLMVRINEAAAANAMNLCVTALLAARKHSLTREQLIAQLECYIQLLRNVPYSPESTVSDMSAEELLNHAICMNKFKTEQHNIDDIIILPREQTILMTYYRNNIHHMLVMPSLISVIVQQHREISDAELLRQVSLVYPMLKNELFLRWNQSELPALLYAICKELVRQGLITLQNGQLNLSVANYHTLQLLAAGICETLQRFTITFAILSIKPTINRSTLEKESRTLAQHLAVLQDINAPEFIDKNVFNTLVLTLRAEGYISDSGDADAQRAQMMWHMLAELMTNDVRLTIESAVMPE